MSQIDAFKTIKREVRDKRVIMLSFPKSIVPGVIIHKICLIDSNFVDLKNSDTLCVECTFLEPGGEDHNNLL